MREGLQLVFVGLSLSSSWGNGHATTYRALLKALAARGHDILFLERDRDFYAAHRDLERPDFCRLAFYDSPEDLKRYRRDIALADAVVVGSYVADGISTVDFIQKTANGLAIFYDIDTPVTVAALEAGRCDYLEAGQIAGFDLYFSFTGGPMLGLLRDMFGVRHAEALYCSADPSLYRPMPDRAPVFDLGYLGTYSADRQKTLEELLLKPARLAPDLHFVVAGPQYPASLSWPANVTHIDHIGPREHAAFYASCRYALNVTRADMRGAGYSPSVRLFEAAACGTPVLSDHWAGLGSIFDTQSEVRVIDRAEHVLAELQRSEDDRRETGQRIRQRFLKSHTSMHRAVQFEMALRTAARRKEMRRRNPAAV